MAYMINELAKISGVSTRTLRFYDKIDLLAPAFYGKNNYRYYKEEQLLMLQQILFLRELGFAVSNIQRILGSNDFDKIEALKAHKSILNLKLERTKTLINTIDKTISHFDGKTIMLDVEMYDGFVLIKQQEHEKSILKTGIISRKQSNESWKRVANWGKNDWERIKKSGEKLNLALATALKQKLKIESKEVQELIQQHYDGVNNFWTPTKETYLRLGLLYLEHPDFRLFYNRYSPELVEYLVAAMKIFAEKKLS